MTTPSDEAREAHGASEAHDGIRRYVLAPQELRNRRQWVCYRLRVRHRRGKPDEITKQPVNARTGAVCDVTDPAMWSCFEEAVAGATRYHLDGIGFCFSREDPYVGIDLDHCRDPESGELTPWGRELVALLDSYSEVSPSGGGAHVIVKAELPPDAGHKRRYEDGAVEVYSEGRFFTITGAALDDTPLLILERQAELDQLRQKVWGTDGRTAATTATAAPAAKGAEAAVSSIALPTCGVTNLSDDDVLAHCHSDATGDHFRAVYDAGDLSGDDGDDSAADFFIWNKLVEQIGVLHWQ